MASSEVGTYFKNGKAMLFGQFTPRDYAEDVSTIRTTDSQIAAPTQSLLMPPISSTSPAASSDQHVQTSDLSEGIDELESTNHRNGDVNVDERTHAHQIEGDSHLKMSNMPDTFTAQPSGQAGIDLMVYRPTRSIPPWKGRLAKTPPPYESKWMIPASWPPSESAHTAEVYQSEVFPSKDIPFHLQIQAYALRWGYWGSKIENKERREEVLKWVTDQMRQAWETAIKDGYYQTSVIPANELKTETTASPANVKKGRKRALSPSKQIAGLTSEGKDPHAVTAGELQQNGITMDMITARAENRDFVAAELLLDEVLTSLARDIQVRDWSASAYAPQVRGRNLLMYCLYVVQQSRSDIGKLEWLQGKFSRDSQKRVTQSRIDNHKERVDQHLALATELRIRQVNSPPKLDETPSVESAPSTCENQQQIQGDVNAKSGQAGVDDAVVQESLLVLDGTGRESILDLAKDVLFNHDKNTLSAMFVSHGISKDSFTEDAGIGVGNDHTLLLVKRLLGAIFDQQTSIESAQESLTQQREPMEKIKIESEMQNARKQITQCLRRLRDLLKQAGYLEQEQNIVQEQVQSTINEHNSEASDKLAGEGEQRNLLASKLPNGIKRPQTDDEYHSSPSHKKPRIETEADPVFNGVQTGLDNRSASTLEPNIRKGDSLIQGEQERLQGPSMGHSAQRDQFVDASKQIYINKIWLPVVNKMLARAGRACYQGNLSRWEDIKELLIHLGYGVDMRNTYLRQFKQGFQDWQNGPGLRTSNWNLAPPAKQLRKEDPVQPPQTNVAPSGTPSSGKHEAQKVSRDQDESTGNEGQSQPSVPNGKALITPPHQLVVKLKLAEAQDFGDYDSHLVNDAPKMGFSFRFLPSATREQRVRLDELIYDYLNSTPKQSRPYGKYVKFVDPEDPDGDEVAYGFWLCKDGSRPENSGWFYAGQDMPEGWGRIEIKSDKCTYLSSSDDVQAPKKKKDSQMVGARRKTGTLDKSISNTHQHGNLGHGSASNHAKKAQVNKRATTTKKPQRVRLVVPDDEDVSGSDYNPSD